MIHARDLVILMISTLITSPQTPKGVHDFFQIAHKFGGPKTSWKKFGAVF